ncbi:MAG: hypothetical protein GXP62_01210 [Oligoflexia bacterium]|nr:hypothetical protein [Oligoflexia bacterium]
MDPGERRRRTEAIALAVILSLGAVLLASAVPVLDEESYLDIASQMVPSRPYDWWRSWQPWGIAHEPDAYVYAHPPLHLLWVWAARRLVPEEMGIRALKILAGVPWAVLYGWAVGALAAQVTRHPKLAVLLALTAPITVLSLQRGLMPDLALAALCTAGVAGWRAGLDGHRLAGVLGGLGLAGAIWTKYPAALLVPVLLVHGRLSLGSWRRLLRHSGAFWLAALLPLCLGEGWLYAIYGRFHPFEVISRAGEISRGDIRVRLLGVLTRLSLGLTPVVLLVRGLRRSIWVGLLIGVAVIALAWVPASLDLGTALRVLPFATLGAALLVASVMVTRSPSAARGPGKPCDGMLLALWAGTWIAGVLLVHNFAAPRYLLPAVVPMALLLARSIDARQDARRVLAVGVVISTCCAVALTVAEHRYFQASSDLAGQIAKTWQSPGVFTGEWSFRYRMSAEGWTVLQPHEASGILVVAPANASPGPLPEIKEHVADYAYGHGNLRVMCVACRVGLYGDTLGVLPVWWSPGPLEEATAWRIK